MQEFIKFFKNRTVQKQLLYAVAGLFIFLEVVFLALRVYTRHGQALTVPNFIGLGIDEVSRMADQKSLRFEIIDSVFTQGQAPGTVIAQNPSPDTKVKVNRTIFLTINAINPAKIEMPNVVDVSLRQAEAILQTNGLRVGYKHYIPYFAKDYVLRQLYRNRDVAPGKKVIKGSAIDLVLGIGSGDANAEIPSLKGLTRDQAQEVLSNKYLNFGAVIYDNSVESNLDSMKAIIWKQKPEYGSTIPTGGSISVWLTVNEAKVKSDSVSRSQNLK
jgi:beta-lactam-binding protein with PASTA domain